jgi:hypothetical protein
VHTTQQHLYILLALNKKKDLMLDADIRVLQRLKPGVVQTVINYAFKRSV